MARPSRNRFSLALSSSPSAIDMHHTSSSQRSPLLPRNVEVPLTINDLPQQEKLNLQKKARKLSRVLGETAVFENMRPSSSGCDPKRPPCLTRSSTGTLKSRASWGLRSRSALAVVSLTTPTFVLPPLRAFVVPRDTSPRSPPAPMTSTSSYFEERLPTGSDVSTTTHFNALDRRMSTESFEDCDVKPERLRRMQMSKVSRALGESNVPPELIAPQDSSSKSTLRRLSRRQSLDVGRSDAEPDRKAVVRRSRSLWLQNESRSPELQARYKHGFTDDLSPPGQEPISDKQRALNVRRARKMAQVFGQEPPPGLYQISHRLDEDDRMLQGGELSRSSTATLPFFGADRAERKSSPRRRQISDSSVSSISDALTTPTKDIIRTPPPFASCFPPTLHSALDSDNEGDDEPELFQDRRRRAAKLTRFFGETYEKMTVPTAASKPNKLSSRRPIVQPASIEEEARGVNVKIINSKFFSRGREKDSDMTLAIDRLRGLRA